MATDCCIAEAQAPIQACLRPAMWVPGLRRPHMARETWLIQANPDEFLEKLLEGVEAKGEEEHLKIHKVLQVMESWARPGNKAVSFFVPPVDREKRYVEIFSFTPGCNWLDVVEVTFRAGEQSGTTIGEALSFSSGLFPVCIPCAFLCNICCFFAPFSGNGFNTHRLEVIRKCLHPIEVTITAETKCNCCPS